MNKRHFSFIISLLVCLCLAGCVVPVEDEAAFEAGEPVADKDSAMGIANPVKAVSREELIEITGIDLGSAEADGDLSYSVIELGEGLPVAQLSFVLDGNEFCYRAQALGDGGIQDISGMYYEWELSEHVFVDYCYAVVYLSGEAGYIKWIDAAPGIQYSLSMTSGADKSLLIETAKYLFEPAQGEVG